MLGTHVIYEKVLPWVAFIASLAFVTSVVISG